MKIPESANVTPDMVLQQAEISAYIKNPYVQKEFLTYEEAINTINLLSGMILIDVNCRRCE